MTGFPAQQGGPLIGSRYQLAEAGRDVYWGRVSLVAGEATVSTPAVTESSIIIPTVHTLSGVATPTALTVTARSPATSFTLTSASALDESAIDWIIFEPPTALP